MNKLLKGICVGALSFSLFGCQSQEKVTLTLAAAASLENCFEEELIPMFEEKYPNIQIEGVYDSSGKLQIQIEEGLEADVFFSAATAQMDTLVDEGLMDSDSVKNILENKLVLIKGKSSDLDIDDFDDLVNAETIAIGDPEIVPAGQYAKEALTNLGVWDQVQSKFSLGSNVTEVLSWVESGSAQVGLVYATDAASSDQVEVIDECDDDLLQTPVLYPAGIVKKSKHSDEAKKLMDFICSEDVLEIFEKYGFDEA